MHEELLIIHGPASGQIIQTQRLIASHRLKGERLKIRKGKRQGKYIFVDSLVPPNLILTTDNHKLNVDNTLLLMKVKRLINS